MIKSTPDALMFILDCMFILDSKVYECYNKKYVPDALKR